jgi:cytoskeletal protein CcmA (bactofilin family)
MAETTIIGASAFVRGRIHGGGDLEIAGRVEGDVACSGDVTIEGSGLIAANVSGRRIVVRGAVKGDLTADDAVVVEAGAKIVGDLKAPRVSIARGGLVRGHVQTGGAGAPRARGHQAQAAAPAARAAHTPAKAAPPPPPAKASTKHVAQNNGRGAAPRGATLAGARIGPPPPVVPALKKGTKAIQKKR